MIIIGRLFCNFKVIVDITFSKKVMTKVIVIVMVLIKVIANAISIRIINLTVFVILRTQVIKIRVWCE